MSPRLKPSRKNLLQAVLPQVRKRAQWVYTCINLCRLTQSEWVFVWVMGLASCKAGAPLLLHHHQIQLKAFSPLQRACWKEKEECVCARWGVRGGGLEGEKGGGGDKRALSALLILYFTSGGCGALSLFPALWVAFTVLRETECHTNIQTQSPSSLPLSLYFTSTHNTHFHTIVCLSHAHTRTETLKVALGDHCMPRQTAYYHTIKHTFQRQNKTICSEEKKEYRWRQGRVKDRAKREKTQETQTKWLQNSRWGVLKRLQGPKEIIKEANTSFVSLCTSPRL